MHDLNRNAQDSLFPFSLPFLSLNMGGGGNNYHLFQSVVTLITFIIEEWKAVREGNCKWPECSLFVAQFKQNEWVRFILNNLSYTDKNF